MAVEHGNQVAMPRQVHQQPLDMAHGSVRLLLTGALCGDPPVMKPVGRGHRKQSDVPSVLANQAGGFHRFRRHGPGIGNDGFGVRSGAAHPVGAVGYVLNIDRGELPHRLGQRSGRQAQIDRSARIGRFSCRALHVVERPAEYRRKLIDIGGFETCQPVLRHADQRRGDRLMRTALTGQADARWRCDQYKSGVLIASIVQCIETTLNKRVVQRPDRQQTLAMDRVGQPQRR